MALVHKNFSEYYNALVSRVPSDHEKLMRVCREETGRRKVIEEEMQNAVADLLHERGVLIAERKEMAIDRTLKDKPSLTKLITLRFQTKNLELLKPGKPNPVARHHPVIRAFPRAKYFSLLKEEGELRAWLAGVELRQREIIEKDCSHSWFLLVCLRQLVGDEEEVRERIQQKEMEEWVRIRRGVFRFAPPEFFRRISIERYGVGTVEEQEEKTIEQQCLESRALLEEEEVEEWKCLLRWLFDMYGVRLFSPSRCEVTDRYYIEVEEYKDLWNIIMYCTNNTYGPFGKYLAATALHGNSYTPLLKILTNLPEKMREAAEIRARMAEVYPPMHESSRESSIPATPLSQENQRNTCEDVEDDEEIAELPPTPLQASPGEEKLAAASEGDQQGSYENPMEDRELQQAPSLSLDGEEIVATPTSKESAAEEPAAEEPAAEEALAEEAAAEEPVGEEPAAQDTAAEEPVAEEPAGEEAAAEEAAAEETAAEEPAAEEPAGEEAAAEEPAAEETATEEPVAEEAAAEEPAAEEAAAEEATAEEPVGEEPAAEEPAAEDTAAEETVGEEPAAEEPAAEETAAEDTAAEEAAAEEPAAEEAAAEEPAAEESAAEEPAAEEPAAEELLLTSLLLR
ncbi:unnamed protein product, partial [Trypanosoma congolense IL3000]